MDAIVYGLATGRMVRILVVVDADISPYAPSYTVPIEDVCQVRPDD